MNERSVVPVRGAVVGTLTAGLGLLLIPALGGACGSTPAPADTRATVITASATIGPSGGHFACPNGISLDVPPGALAEPTTLTATVGAPVPPALASVSASRVQLSVQFGPEGLLFLKPVQINIPTTATGGAPIDPAHVVLVSVDNTETDESLSSAQGEPQANILQPLPSGGAQLSAQMWHFSTVAALQPAAGTLGALTSVNTATADTQGISQQILDVFLASNPTALQQIASGGNLQLNSSAAAFPYLTPATATALQDAASKAKGTILVNTAWRSLATQFVIYRSNNSNKSAQPGNSDHGVGAAVDIQPNGQSGTACKKAMPSCSDNDCIADTIFPDSSSALKDAGFTFEQFCAPHSCCDPVHWDSSDADAAQALRSELVKAFQTLWLNNNPCSPIPMEEIGVVPVSPTATPKTWAALLASPAAGFPGEVPVLQPAQGTQGLGCGLAAPLGDGGGALLCCPGSRSTCQALCGPADGGKDGAGDGAGMDGMGPETGSGAMDGGSGLAVDGAGMDTGVVMDTGSMESGTGMESGSTAMDAMGMDGASAPMEAGSSGTEGGGADAGGGMDAGGGSAESGGSGVDAGGGMDAGSPGADSGAGAD